MGIRILLFLLLLCGTAHAEGLKKEASKPHYKASLGGVSDSVSIGGNDTSFKPQISVNKWQGEAVLTIKQNKTYSAEPSVSKDNYYKKDKVSVSDGNSSFYACPYDSDILKFGIDFDKKPATNKITFQLDGWENFDFFYQPELTKEEVDMGCTRPDNVVGSYAVYHKTKKDYVIGGINYGTGKFCHIYRPKFIDAKGDTAWGNLSIEKGNYTVTIPQDFLDKAEYPVKANDALGYSSVGASASSYLANYAYAMTPTTASASGTATSISFYIYTAGGDSNNTFGFYNDSSNYPNALQGDTGAFNVNATQQWWTVDLDSPVSITNGATYWFARKSDSSISYKYDTVTNNNYYYISSAYSAGNMPNPFPASAPYVSSYRHSAYLTYTPGGATVDDTQLILIN